MPDVLVVGSINQDFVLRVERRPQPGETVTGAELSLHGGGKGANQAAAAALLGARVAFLGRVGDDAFGKELVRELGETGVDTSLVSSAEGVHTGTAFITVTPDGENAITVAPGANRALSPTDVDLAWRRLGGLSVVVCQMEIPLACVEQAARLARKSGARFVLNLAPPSRIPEDLLRSTDVLVVNEHEAAFLLGREVESVGGASRAAGELLARGPGSAVVTLGASGAVVAAPGDVRHVPAPRVEAVDTTAAGDAFVGALAARIAADDTLEEAVSYAVAAGAITVTRPGARSALPSSSEVISLASGG